MTESEARISLKRGSTAYRVHLSSGDWLFPTKAEAFRQAKNISRAAQGSIWVTEETWGEPEATRVGGFFPRAVQKMDREANA